MNRSILKAILKMCAKAILLALMIGIAIVVIGYLKNWSTSIAYSNAFFIAGSVLIVAGAFSRLGAGQDWHMFQSLSAESFRGMSSGERADFIVKVSTSYRVIILSILSGLLLILVSALFTIKF
jgi:hypothetical protein